IDPIPRRLRHVLDSQVRNYRHELRHLASSDRLGLVPRRIALARERLARRRVSLFRLLDLHAKSMRRRLNACDAPLAAYPARIARERQHPKSPAATLNALSPPSLLSR